MAGVDRRNSRCHVRSREATWSTPSTSLTVVTLSTAGPTAVRHANATFSGVSGAFLMIAASAPGITFCNDTTSPKITGQNPNPKTQIPTTFS
jgi:hypothetical protein